MSADKVAATIHSPLFKIDSVDAILRLPSFTIYIMVLQICQYRVRRMSRLSQMLLNEQARRGLTDYKAAKEIGVLQQTYSSWKHGSVPRPNRYAAIAGWLGISPDMVRELAEEAGASTGSTKLPNIGAPLMGRGSATALTLDKLPIGFAKPEISGCYAVRIDGRNMWVNPNITPADGNTVILRSDGQGRIAQWPVEHDGEVHVVVLAEMI
ncbi:helix-turn-helix domain-containing protein [Sinorhizobium meliloti]|uniref:helix-turn-helix domain-containing protein n=1 Tax=Rhizobium meliloti TaxID=382 RepID=UPI001F238906|nr:helix-turn-helix transcriptional regulator [Sinorhizobium meliloti]